MHDGKLNNSTLSRKPFREGKARREAPMPKGAGPKRGRKKTRKVGLSNSVYRPKHALGTRKRLVEDLDEVCSLIVRHRDGWRCIVCGDGRTPQACHLYSRKKLVTRWNLDNLFCGCDPHNELHNTNEDPFTFAVVRRIGPERIAAVRDAAHAPWKKIPDADLMALLEERREQLRAMPKTEREAA